MYLCWTKEAMACEVLWMGHDMDYTVCMIMGELEGGIASMLLRTGFQEEARRFTCSICSADLAVI